VVEIVEEIRSNYLTRAEFRAFIDEQLSHYATKEDLERMRQDTRNWVITVGLSLAALQFTMQMVFFQWYTHLR
jgi:ATP/maltotriose-dependent transcriptional regulator MalT